MPRSASAAIRASTACLILATPAVPYFAVSAARLLTMILSSMKAPWCSQRSGWRAVWAVNVSCRATAGAYDYQRRIADLRPEGEMIDAFRGLTRAAGTRSAALHPDRGIRQQPAVDRDRAAADVGGMI